jgi:hypothetical protein
LQSLVNNWNENIIIIIITTTTTTTTTITITTTTTTIIIIIIIGATGIITRSLRKNLEAVPGKYSIVSLQQCEAV